MKKNEALKLAIDGKKVHHIASPKVYYVFKNGEFMRFDGYTWLPTYTRSAPTCKYAIKSEPEDGWEVVPEYVTFAEAWKAYEDGKEIISVRFRNSKRKNSIYCDDKSVRFLPEEIREQWIVLERKEN